MLLFILTRLGDLFSECFTSPVSQPQNYQSQQEGALQPPSSQSQFGSNPSRVIGAFRPGILEKVRRVSEKVLESVLTLFSLFVGVRPEMPCSLQGCLRHDTAIRSEQARCILDSNRNISYSTSASDFEELVASAKGPMIMMSS